MKNRAVLIVGLCCIAAVAINAFIWMGLIAKDWSDSKPAANQN